LFHKIPLVRSVSFPSYFFHCTYLSRYPLGSASQLTNASTLTLASLAHHMELPVAFSISNFQRYFWNVVPVAECGMANAPPAVERETYGQFG
jgi:hypothetical protein